MNRRYHPAILLLNGFKFVKNGLRNNFLSVNETVNNISVITAVAEPFQAFFRSQTIAFILQIVQNQGIEQITRLDLADLAEHFTASYSCHVEGVRKYQSFIIRFVEFLHLGYLYGTGYLTVDTQEMTSAYIAAQGYLESLVQHY